MSDLDFPTWAIVILIGFLFSIVVRESVKREFKEDLEFQKAQQDTVFIIMVREKAFPDSLILKPAPEDSLAPSRKKN